MGKIIQKARQDMIIAQENINPDFGSLSLWIGYQLQISLGFYIKIAMVKLLQVPSPYCQRHLPFSFPHWADGSPSPVSSGEPNLEQVLGGPGAGTHSGVTNSINNALNNRSVG